MIKILLISICMTLSLSWEACFQRKRLVHLVKISSCMFWPIMCSLSGPIDCQNANKAEFFAMLMGCCEVRKFEASNAIIEGDYFSAIQWGSCRSKYP